MNETRDKEMPSSERVDLREVGAGASPGMPPGLANLIVAALANLRHGELDVNKGISVTHRWAAIDQLQAALPRAEAADALAVLCESELRPMLLSLKQDFSTADAATVYRIHGGMAADLLPHLIAALRRYREAK